jgi:hypothetical protein
LALIDITMGISPHPGGFRLGISRAIINRRPQHAQENEVHHEKFGADWKPSALLERLVARDLQWDGKPANM